MARIFEQDLANTEARGRNGWFRAARVSVRAGDGPTPVTLDVASRQPYGDLPPIVLNLSREDAETLQRLLHQALAAPAAATQRPTGTETEVQIMSEQCCGTDDASSEALPTVCPDCGGELAVDTTVEFSGMPLRDGGAFSFEEVEGSEVLRWLVACRRCLTEVDRKE